MYNRQYLKQKASNSGLVLLAFGCTLLFQVTSFKAIWSIELASRLLNSATVVLFSLYAFASYNQAAKNRTIALFYLLPGLFVYSGFWLNITRGTLSNINVVSQYGLLIPWALYLCIPTILRTGKLDVARLWHYYYHFMVVTCFISILEYNLIFSGILDTRTIYAAHGGYFAAANLSILYASDSGEFHYRLYGPFLEPGTFAMFLLPALAYGVILKRYLSSGVLLIAIYMADSLGGYVGVAMMVPLLFFFKLRKVVAISVVVAAFSVCAIFALSAKEFTSRYAEKGASADAREESLRGAIQNLPTLLLSSPMGLRLTESTEKAFEQAGFSGFNFTPGNAFYFGGILGFLGYLVVLAVSVWYAVESLGRKALSPEEHVAVTSIICLFPFIFQRTVIWDSGLYALLLAPYIISRLLKGRRASVPPNRVSLPKRSRLRSLPSVAS